MEIPETDLVRIAEREALQAAKSYVSEWQKFSGPHRLRLASENLIAAISLLEARERSAKELAA